MRQCADFADRIQDAGSGFIVRGVNKCNIRIVFECFFNNSQVGLLINRELQVDMRQTVKLADFDCSCAVGTVIHDQNFFTRRQKRIDTHINIDCAASAEKY